MAYQNIPAAFGSLYVGAPPSVYQDMVEYGDTFQAALEALDEDFLPGAGFLTRDDEMFDAEEILAGDPMAIEKAMYQASVGTADSGGMTPYGPALRPEAVDTITSVYPGTLSAPESWWEEEEWEEWYDEAEGIVGQSSEAIDNLLDAVSRTAEGSGAIGSEDEILGGEIPVTIAGYLSGRAEGAYTPEDMTAIMDEIADNFGNEERTMTQTENVNESVDAYLSGRADDAYTPEGLTGIMSDIESRPPRWPAGQRYDVQGRFEEQSIFDDIAIAVEGLQDPNDIADVLGGLMDEGITFNDVEEYLEGSVSPEETNQILGVLEGKAADAELYGLVDKTPSEPEVVDYGGYDTSTAYGANVRYAIDFMGMSLEEAEEWASKFGPPDKGGVRDFQAPDDKPPGQPLSGTVDLDAARLAGESEPDSLNEAQKKREENLRATFYKKMYALPGGISSERARSYPGMYFDTKALFFLETPGLWELYSPGALLSEEDDAKNRTILDNNYNAFLNRYLANPAEFRTGANFYAKLDDVADWFQLSPAQKLPKNATTAEMEEKYLLYTGLFGDEGEGPQNRGRLLAMSITRGQQGYYSDQILSAVNKMAAYYRNIGKSEDEIFGIMARLGRKRPPTDEPPVSLVEEAYFEDTGEPFLPEELPMPEDDVSDGIDPDFTFELPSDRSWEWGQKKDEDYYYPEEDYFLR